MPDDALTDAREDAAAEALVSRLEELAASNPTLFRVAVARMTGALPPAGEPASQAKVAKAFGISRRQVRQIEARALYHLRTRLQP